MKNIILFLVLLPIYLAMAIGSALLSVILFVFGIPYIVGRMVWAEITGRSIGPGW